MATLTPLVVGNANTPSGWTSAPNGALGDNSDATFGYYSTSTDSQVDQGWVLADVDADFGTMDTLSVILRYGWSATPGNDIWELAAAPGTAGLQCRIISGATILAAADSGGAFATIVAAPASDATIRNSSAYVFSTSGYLHPTADKTLWDAAVVEIRISRNRIKGGSTEQQRVYEADFTGTYTIADPKISTPGAVALTATLLTPTVTATDNKVVTPDPIGGAGVSPTVAFTCGAECDLSHWDTVTGPVTVDTGTKRSGAASIQIAAAGAASSANYIHSSFADTVVRFSIRFSSLPVADANLVFFYGDTAANGNFGYDATAGKFVVGASVWASRVAASSTVVVDTWYTIDLRLNMSNGAGASPRTDWAIDGTTQTAFVGPGNNQGSTQTLIGQGGDSTQFAAFTTFTAYVDNLVISSTSGDYPIADGSVVAGETWTPTPSGLVLTPYIPTVTVAPPADITVTPDPVALTLTALVPTVTAADPQVVTPGLVALTLTPAAPTVTASDHQTATPGPVALTATLLVPTVAVTAHQLVTPDPVAVTLTGLVPTAAVSDNIAATPGPVALALSPLAPTVTASDNITATPGAVALTATLLAPAISVSDNITATPDVASLAATLYAPTVATTDHQTATPDASALTLAAFAPTVTAVGSATATPDPAALTATLYAPTVATTAHQTATPDPASLTATLYTPVVATSDHKTATPDASALTLTAFAPVVSADAGVTARPDAAALTISALAPTVATTANQTVTPDAASLTLALYAPTVTAAANQTVTPDAPTLTLTALVPVVTATDHQTITPGPVALTLAAYAPVVSANAGITATPGVVAVTVTAFAPTIATTANVYITPGPLRLTLTGAVPSIAGDAIPFGGRGGRGLRMIGQTPSPDADEAYLLALGVL